MQPGNAGTNEYNYITGSGMDDFLSRSIDEVSWQDSLSSVYTSLNTLPIGQSPTTATPTNYDTTQVSGSLGGAYSMGGGSTQGNGGGSSGNIVIDGVNGTISVLDNNGNTVGIIGKLNG